MNFPDSPTPGLEYTYGEFGWTFDGVGWRVTPPIPGGRTIIQIYTLTLFGGPDYAAISYI